ncbi:hydrogenase iron-sulfur subunit, partial [Candidatus Bathyarchaeota archaeon]|nr:hydrogenase iron-sulfur subunit [Candidatus Bathyarchaeota archaeon]
ARELGVNFIRGKVAQVAENSKTKNLLIRAEDMTLGEPIEIESELLVLSTAAIPSKNSSEISRILSITRGGDGFFMECHPKLKPLDTSVDGIFLAGACQGPKDIPYSVSQGSGAAARAATVLSQPTWKIEPIIASINPEKCKNTISKCGICLTKCPYGAIKALEKQSAIVTTAMCHGCGTCVAECPSDAITQLHFTDKQIQAQIQAALENKPEEKILGFLCNWCSYAGADLAGTSRFEYPPTMRAIRVMCSGRVDKDFVLDAFRRGAGMIMVGACHLPYDCHYISGNYEMKSRMNALGKIFEKLGLSKERFRVEYVSAAEGVKFAAIMKEMSDQLKVLGPTKIRIENEKIRPVLDRMLSRKKK